jgi:hypothetical protein
VVVVVLVLLTEGRRSEVEDLFMGGSTEVFPKMGRVSRTLEVGRVTYVLLVFGVQVRYLRSDNYPEADRQVRHVMKTQGGCVGGVWWFGV